MPAIEQTLLESGITKIAGVDEAGRGPCAGPLVIASVILRDPLSPLLSKVRDSKVLSAAERERQYLVIEEQAEAISIIEISNDEIDRNGLHKSNLEGFRRAVSALMIAPDYVITDGYAIEGLDVPTLGIWKGDHIAVSISAASIVAKVHRDKLMLDIDKEYPGYGFASHKGYSSKAHIAAIRELGVTPIHRKSFANIAALLS